jgi:hypothetical protein
MSRYIAIMSIPNPHWHIVDEYVIEDDGIGLPDNRWDVPGPVWSAVIDLARAGYYALSVQNKDHCLSMRCVYE